MHAHVHTCTRMRAHTYVQTHAHIDTHTQTDTQRYTHTDTETYTDTQHTHTHTHTHTHKHNIHSYVTGFTKTVPNRTRTEIQFIAEHKTYTLALRTQKHQTHGYRWPSLLSQMAFC